MRKITIWVSVTLAVVALVIAYELNAFGAGNAGHHPGNPMPSGSMPAGHHAGTPAPGGSMPAGHHK
jgi:hypothetical protein